MFEEITRHFLLINKLAVFLINAVGLELAFWVYFTNRREKSNQLFFFFTLFLLLWVDFDFLGTFAPFLFPEADVQWITLLSTRLVFAMLCPFFLFFYYIPTYLSKLAARSRLMEATLAIVWGLLFFASFTQEIVSGARLNPVDPIAARVETGRLFLFYVLAAIGTFSFSLYNSFSRYKKLESGDRQKFQLVLTALVLFGVFNLFFNIIIPAYSDLYLGTISLVGDYSMIFLLAFSGFLILKERLFGIKIILTEILIGLMGAILAVMPFLIEVPWQQVLLSLLFFLFCVFSYLLVKSTIREYQEKEQLEQQVGKRTRELEDAKKNLEEMNIVLEIRVAARTEELKKLNQTLEEKVKDRTVDLRQKIVDLEKFQKLTVGRELKMIELKKEIDSQKLKLKQMENRKKEG